MKCENEQEFERNEGMREPIRRRGKEMGHSVYSGNQDDNEKESEEERKQM